MTLRFLPGPATLSGMSTTTHRRFHPVAGPLKVHGGKGAHGDKLARWIVSLMPPHRRYVEPFAGGLAVLRARGPADRRLWLADNGDDRGVAEVVNDLDGTLANFWRVLGDPALFAEFCRRVEAVPFGRPFWEAARDHAHGQDPVADAVALFVLVRQSRQGERKCFATPSPARNRGGMDERSSAWIHAVEGLAKVHARLFRVVVENMDALDLIRREDGPGTLFYCDPPYLHGTRTARRAYGPFEMTDAQHRELLDVLRRVKGKVMLSGYPNPLYDGALAGWTRHTMGVPNHASSSRRKRKMTEVLWCNF
jgi:DNA adenine methylase